MSGLYEVVVCSDHLHYEYPISSQSDRYDEDTTILRVYNLMDYYGKNAVEFNTFVDQLV